jgi:hypothetical protein
VSYSNVTGGNTAHQGESTTTPLTIATDFSSTGADGTIIYRTASVTKTIPFHIQDRGDGLGHYNCEVTGTAITAT